MKIFNKIINTPDKKKLFSNFVSLAVLQAANYILPLVTFPYLVRVLGVEKFGLLAFATATVTYFQILTDYGFNLSATRDISIHRENKEKVQEIFSSVMVIKFGLLILSFFLLTILILSFDKFRKDWEVFVLSFGMVVGQVLFPVWFFQGMEKMKYITILNIFAKLLFTIAIFVFVKEQADYWKVPLLNSLGFIMAGVLALWIVSRDYKISFIFPSIKAVKHQLIEGWHIFISTVGINMYKQNSIFVLGIFTDDTVVGYFSIAKKIMDLVNSLNGVVSQSIYPYTMMKMSSKYIYGFLKKVGMIIALYTSIIGLILLVFSDAITKLLAGNVYYQTLLSIKLLAFVPLFIGINVPAVHILLGNKKDALFTRAVILGGLLDLLLNFLIVPFFSYIGSCTSVILTEIAVTSILYKYALEVIHYDYKEKETI